MADKQMSLEARREYLRRMRTRYRLASRSENGILLDEMARVTQMHRKSLILSRHSLSPGQQKRQQGRGKTYAADIQHVLRIVCESFDYPCAERLVGNLGWMAEQLVECGSGAPRWYFCLGRVCLQFADGGCGQPDGARPWPCWARASG